MTAIKVSQLCLGYKAPNLHRPLPSVTAEYNLLEYSHWIYSNCVVEACLHADLYNSK